jgi:apolipoprotein N-acyltransferase
VRDATDVYQQAARAWAVGRATTGQTFYTRQGDWFAALCAATTAAGLLSTYRFRRRPSGVNDLREIRERD